MKLTHIVMILIFSCGMGIGQLLLKLSAIRQASYAQADIPARMIALLKDWPFLLGGTLYALLLVYWVWLLTFIPLSRAYPFTLVSLAVAAFGSALFFNEPLSGQFLAGLAIIGAGLIVISI